MARPRWSFATALAAALGALAMTYAPDASTDPKPLAPRAPAAGARGGAPSIQKYALPDNGLEVVLVEDHRVPQVAMHVTHRAGRRDDPPGRRGMADLMERLLAEPSTRHASSASHEDLRSALGARPWPKSGVTAYLDYTSARYSLPATDVALAIWLASDRMGFAADGAHEAELNRAREKLAEDARANSAKPYASVFDEVLAAVVGEGHSYSNVRPGFAPELASVTPSEARARLRTHYGPGNSALIIAGDFDRAKVSALIATYFGPLAAAPRPPPPKAARIALAGERRLRVEANVDRPMVIMAWPTPPLYDPGDVALDGVARALGRRLFVRLVKDLKVAVEVGARQRSNEIGSVFVVNAKVAPTSSVDEVRGLLDEEIERLRSTELPPEEARRAKLLLLTETALVGDTLDGRASQVESFFMHTGDPGYFGVYFGRYDALTAASLRSAAAQHLPAGQRLVAIVEPNPAAPRAGRVVREK